jgi:pyochelin biosynthesis protein PchC
MSEWFRRYRPRDGASLRLVCFPPAGAAASFYRGWAERLPHSVELVAVCYPGRETRIGEPAWEDMHALAEAVTTEFSTLPPMDTALFGHSMGASLAFEIARRLEERGVVQLTRGGKQLRMPEGRPARQETLGIVSLVIGRKILQAVARQEDQ